MAVNRKISLFEQIDELQAEWDRRHRAYPLMVARGLVRHHVVQTKQGRLAAAIRTLIWLEENQEMIRSFAEYHGKHVKTEREVARALEQSNETTVAEEAAG